MPDIFLLRPYATDTNLDSPYLGGIAPRKSQKYLFCTEKMFSMYVQGKHL